MICGFVSFRKRSEKQIGNKKNKINNKFKKNALHSVFKYERSIQMETTKKN